MKPLTCKKLRVQRIGRGGSFLVAFLFLERLLFLFNKIIPIALVALVALYLKGKGIERGYLVYNSTIYSWALNKGFYGLLGLLGLPYERAIFNEFASSNPQSKEERPPPWQQYASASYWRLVT